MHLLGQSTPCSFLGWANFYEILGSSAGALIGLQFVVITLIASVRGRASVQAIGAFSTPTVIHFGVVLTLSAVLCAPLSSVLVPAATVVGCGAFGLAYAAVALMRALRQSEYKPDAEDWVWYIALPAVANALLCIVGTSLMTQPAADVLFYLAATVLGLLLIGIHNAWDTITHIVATAPTDEQSKRS